MMGKRIGVGIIGAAPDRGWAALAHIPAIKSLSGRFTVTAVCMRGREFAAKAAEAFRVPKWFDDPLAMATDPWVDLVVLVVKGAQHYATVNRVIKAGKPILCEWPSGASAEESGRLSGLGSGSVIAVAWRCRSLEGFMDLSALAGPEPGRAVSGLTEANVALTRSGLFGPSDYLRRSFVLAFPRGTPPSDQLGRFTADKHVLSCLTLGTKCHPAAWHA